MHARKILAPLVVTVAAVGVLAGMGAWQLHRKAIKDEVAAALDGRRHEAAITLPVRAAWGSLRPDKDEFRRVRLNGKFGAISAALVYTSGSPLRPDVSGQGYWVFSPLVSATGEIVAVNRGFISEAEYARHAGAISPQPGSVTVTGRLRFPEKAQWYMPQPKPGDRIWLVRDPVTMAQALGWGEVAPFYIDAEEAAPADPIARSGPLQIAFRNDHAYFAAAWFAMAGAVLIIFAVWLRRRIRTADLHPIAR
jgi:cytochrome oxidase assembly protein ShyY1